MVQGSPCGKPLCLRPTHPLHFCPTACLHLPPQLGWMPLWKGPWVLSCLCLQNLPGWGAQWELIEPSMAPPPAPLPQRASSRAAGGPGLAQALR